MNDDALIVCQNLSKTYALGKNNQVEALKATNITINKGDYVAIIGPSGSGKSTFMNLLGCLDQPSGGHYFLDTIDVSTLHDNRLALIRRKEIGFIFQRYNLISTLSAIENVALAMSFAGVHHTERVKRAKDLLHLVQLDHRLNHKPNEMSGGEQQRVAIARALSNNPTLLLADEPTGNVDTTAGNMIMDILESINHKGETIIIVTHDPSIAERAQRVLTIKDGVVSEDS